MKAELSEGANNKLKAKSAKIAVVLKAAAGSQRSYLLGLRTPRDILTKLEEVNGGSSKGTLSTLQQQFSSPDPSKCVDDVASMLSQLQSQISSISKEDKPTELSKKDVLLRCYHEKYRTTVETLRIVAGEYTFAQIVEKLRLTESETKIDNRQIALQADHQSSNGAKKKDKRKCYYCGKIRHIKPDCKKKKHDEKSWQKKGQDTKPESAGIAWIANRNIYIGSNDWCVDSGATSHMTYDKSIFVDYEDFSSTVGTAKTDVSLSVVGRGKVCCPINGQNTIFEGVLHIPELHSNLLSPGKLTTAGLSVSLGANMVTISRGEKVVAKGPRIGDTWVLRAKNLKESALLAHSASQEETLLWHRRLGHPGQEKMNLFHQAVDGMPCLQTKSLSDCNTCNLTKSVRRQNREPPKNPASKKLERVFVDTWGPYKHPSIGGNRYMLVIIDEYSRMS